MHRLDPRSLGDDRAWEHRLFPLLLTAFAIAALATLATTTALTPIGPAATHHPHALALTASRARPQADEPASRGDLVPVTVADVVVQDGESTSVALLMDRSKEWVVPVYMDAAQARRLERGLHEAPADRSQATTAALVGRAVERLGGKVVRVEIDDLAPDASLGEVVLERDGHEVHVDARPEEALEIALATGAPVFAASRVVSTRGIKREDVLQGPSGLPTPNRHSESL